jgi:hypothetical protein
MSNRMHFQPATQQDNSSSVPLRNPPGYGASGFGLPLRRDQVVTPFELMHPESRSAERAPLTMFEEAFQLGTGIAPQTTLLESALSQASSVTPAPLPIRPTQAPQLGPPSVSDNTYTEMLNLGFSRPASDAGSRSSTQPVTHQRLVVYDGVEDTCPLSPTICTR